MTSKDKTICTFCTKGELAIALVTAAALPIGEKCYFKAIERGVIWNSTTKTTVLRSQLRTKRT